jgi:hypothetical protein
LPGFGSRVDFYFFRLAVYLAFNCSLPHELWPEALDRPWEGLLQKVEHAR